MYIISLTNQVLTIFQLVILCYFMIYFDSIPIPNTVLSRPPIQYDEIEKQLNTSYPIIIKLASGSRGEAVWKVNNRQEFMMLLPTLDSTQPMIIQEYVSYSYGRDIRCLVVGNQVIASMMRISETGSFKANIHAGAIAKPLQAQQGLIELAVDTAQLCYLDITGVDILIDTDTYKICEVNSSPGIEGLERATGIDCAYAQINHIIQWYKNTIAHNNNSVRQRKFSISQMIGDVEIQQDLKYTLTSPSHKFTQVSVVADELNLHGIDEHLATTGLTTQTDDLAK